MRLLILLLTAATAGLYFYYPIPALYENHVKYGLFALIGLAILLELLRLCRPGTPQGQESIPADNSEDQASPRIAQEDALARANLVQFVAQLQKKGRFLDFVMDDITPYSNEDVGNVARIVHQGCQEVIRSYLDPAPLHEGEEQSEVTLAADYDGQAYRLLGQPPESGPVSGKLLHPGWRSRSLQLPRISDPQAPGAQEILAPAEIETEA